MNVHVGWLIPAQVEATLVQIQGATSLLQATQILQQAIAQLPPDAQALLTARIPPDQLAALLSNSSRIFSETPQPPLVAGQLQAAMAETLEGGALLSGKATWWGAVDQPMAASVAQAGSEVVYRGPEAASSQPAGQQATKGGSSFLPAEGPRGADIPSVPVTVNEKGGAEGRVAWTITPPAVSHEPPRAADLAGRIDQLVREVLVQLKVASPGTPAEEAASRMVEVLKAWQAGTQGESRLPASIVREVSLFLASAVLSQAFSAPPSTGDPKGRREVLLGDQAAPPQGTRQETVGRGVSTGIWTSFSPEQIAKAVITVLYGPTAWKGLVKGSESVPPRPVPMPARPSPQAANKSQGSSRPDGKGRGDEARRQGERAAASRTTEPERETTVLRPREEDRSAQTTVEGTVAARTNEREGHGGSKSREEEGMVHVGLAVHGALREAGYLTASNVLRPLLTVTEGEAFLRLLSSLVPEGSDLIDLLRLMDRQGISWSDRQSVVNDALRRLGRYEELWGGDKGRAVWEPLGDVAMTLELVKSNLMTIEESGLTALDLIGFEVHGLVVAMILNREDWFGRLVGPVTEDVRAERYQELRDYRENARLLIEELQSLFWAKSFETPARSVMTAYFATSPLPN